MSAPPPSLPPLDDTFGAALIGCMLGAILYGISIVQCLYYYTYYSADSKYYRILVAVVFVLDTVPLILAFDTDYFYLIKNFDHPEVLARSYWMAQLGILFGTLTAVIVQCFYILRVWRLSRSYLLACSILVLSLAEFAIGIFWVTKTLPMKTFEQLKAVQSWTIAANILQAVIDGSVAVSICYMLYTARSPFNKTNALINRLILFFINAGVLTSIAAIGVVVFIAATPHAFIHAAWYICLGRLYTNSLLAALNSRRIIRGQVEDIDITRSSEATGTTSGSTTMPSNIAFVLDTITTGGDLKSEAETSCQKDAPVV